MNSLVIWSNRLEIEFDANPNKTINENTIERIYGSQFRKFEKWFDKARFGNFCRRIGLRSGVVLGLVLVA